MSDVSITTGSRNIIIGSGPSNEGIWHRAVMVALELHKAGLWDGIAKLTLNYPYQLHQRLFGIERAKPSDLIPGQDYSIYVPKKKVEQFPELDEYNAEWLMHLAVPPRRTIDFDPDKIAEAAESHEWIMRKFAEASAANAPTFGPREAEALMRATTPTCKRCGIMHDSLRTGLCPGCYDEVTTF